MSGDIFYKYVNDNLQLLSSCMLTERQGIQINEKFIFKFPKGCNNVASDVKKSCKVLHFSSEWNFNEILTIFNELEPKEYLQLFIFKIECKKSEDNKNLSKLEEKLLKFDDNRPIIIQINSTLYCKEINSLKFITINQHQADSSTHISSRLNNNIDKIEHDILKKIQQLKNRMLLLKIFQTLTFSEQFFGSLILNIASNGTKSEFFASLDSPFECCGRVLSVRAQQYLSDIFGEENDPESSDSVLLSAIKNKNTEIVDYIMTYWSHLVQKLPFNHQVRVSTTAMETEQFHVLCDLLNKADYPFPKDFIVDHVECKRLRKITAERIDLKIAIEAENYNKISTFVRKNPRLRFIYSYDNKSALTIALDLRKYDVFYYLKSLGCRGENCENLLEILSTEEQRKAVKQAITQRKSNVHKAQRDCNKSVSLLSAKSLIHNMRVSEDENILYRLKILKWLEDIRKIAPEMIDVAASCESLQIIFDFESCSVEEASLTGSNASGSTYPMSKWIFIGSSLSVQDDEHLKRRENQIKGILAHELCHYVMRLVYENNENPYYEHMTRDKETFDEIVKAIDKWSSVDSENPNDDCNNVISSVFKLYNPIDFHPELIVRIVQILSEFGDDNEHIQHLQVKYKRLFGFWDNIVVPELQKYMIEDRKSVRKLNRTFSLIKDFESNEIQLSFATDLRISENIKSIIIKTNITKLLIINICKNFYQIFGNQLDTQTLFVNLKKLKDENVLCDLQKLIAGNTKVNIIIDYSKDIGIDLQCIKFNENSNLIFIISNEIQQKNVEKILQNFHKSFSMFEVNYNWSHLTEESQIMLLQKRIKFQNKSDLTLLDLLKKDAITNNNKELLNIYSEIIDDYTLNLLLDGSKELTINPLKRDENDKKFDLLFQTRNFLKNSKFDQTDEIPKISQESLLLELKNEQFVIISDKPGNGKSWALKKIAKSLREQNPTNWVCYVNLKKSIDRFKPQDVNLEFSTFMINNILKPENQFDAKIFQKMYNSGKVFILFDGFDDISQNFEFLLKLFQNFQSNGGNQLWIAIRDDFGDDFMKKLQIDVTYSLKKMSEDESVEMIAKIWILMNIKEANLPKSKKDFDEVIGMSKDYQKYQQNARKIIKNISIQESDSFGPQMFKIIADRFKDHQNDINNLHGLKIYAKIADIFDSKWNDTKGANQEDFYKFHQYHAMTSMFPMQAKILFSENNLNEWSKNEIGTYSLMIKKDGKINFSNEIFREYFIADFILKSLKMSTCNEIIVDIFVEIMIDEKFKFARNFLNENFDENISMKKFQLQLQKIIKTKNFHKFFAENYQIGLIIVKSSTYEMVEKMFAKSINSVIYETEEKFLAFQNILINDFKVNDLKSLIIIGEIFQGILCSNLEIEIFDNFLEIIKSKTNQDFIRQGLIQASKDKAYTNIFNFLYKCPNLNAQKVKQLLKIMEKFFTNHELIEMMSKCNENEENILHICVREKSGKKLKILWIELQKYLMTQNFVKFIKQRSKLGQNLLHFVADCNEFEIHETLWNGLLTTIVDREEIEELILQNLYAHKIIFTHKLVHRNQNSAIVEWTFDALKLNFNKIQLKDILASKGWKNMNLLQTAAFGSKRLKIHEFLWKFFQDFYGSDKKFIKMLKETDEDGRNVVHIAARYSTSKIFEFLIKELGKIATLDEIQEILKNVNSMNQNLMQSAAELNKSLHLHKALWEILQKYFDDSEIKKFIINVDKHGNNLLINAVLFNNKEIVQLTFKEIQSFLTYEEQIEYLKTKRKNGKNLIETSLDNRDYHEEVYDWIKNLMKDYKIENLQLDKDCCIS